MNKTDDRNISMNNSQQFLKIKNIEIELYTKILEVDLFAFAYRLFHRDFSPFNRAFFEL